MELPPPYPPSPGSPPGSAPRDSADSKRDKRIRILEDIFILICIVSLWPVVLGWQGAVYEVILYVALAGLVLIFFRRMNRFRQARREAEGGRGNGA